MKRLFFGYGIATGMIACIVRVINYSMLTFSDRIGIIEPSPVLVIFELVWFATGGLSLGLLLFSVYADWLKELKIDMILRHNRRTLRKSALSKKWL